MPMNDDGRGRLFTDESRVLNMDMNNTKRLSYMAGYIF